MIDTNDGRLSPSARFFANAVPAMIGMTLTSGVVVVDGLFIGRFIGSAALAAVNLTVPVLYLFMAIAIMIAVGGSSIASPLLGSGKAKEAARVRSASLVLLVSLTVLLSAAVALFRSPLLGLLGAAATRPPTPGPTRFHVRGLPRHDAVHRSIHLPPGAGEPVAALRNGLVANLVNVALDWLFIVGAGWGVGGAAAASIIASICGAGLSVLTAIKGGERLAFGRPAFKADELALVFGNGSSEFVSQLSVMISSWAFNRATLSMLGTAGLAAMTVMGYLAFIESMLVSGCSIGLAPIVGFGWGAGESGTVRAARRTAQVTAGAIGAAFLLFAVAGGRSFAAVWTGGDPGVTSIVAGAFAIYATAFLLNGYNLLASAFLTSLQDAVGSAAVAVLRGLVLPVALIALLPRILGVTGLWLAVPVAEAVTLIAAFPLNRRGLRKLETGYEPRKEAAA
jgi:Na+-driven multidrug efflux pump